MPRMYTAAFGPTALTVATTDLLAIQPADDIPVRVAAIRVFQTTDVGDAQDEVIGLKLVRGNTTAGSGGATFTPIAVNSKDPAASSTVRAGDTTAASSGTAVNVYQTGWNVRAPFEVFFPEDLRRGSDQGTGFLVLRLAAAPADSLTITAEIDFVEII